MILVVLGGAVLAAAGALAVVHSRSSRRLLDEYAARVDAFTVITVSWLARECVREFDARLGVRLDLGDLDGTAWKLDEVLRSQRAAFLLATEDRPLRTAELAGAAMGELVRRHGGGEWMTGGRSPGVRVRLPEGDREILPFVDALNQFRSGGPGDLHALILYAAGRAGARLRRGHWAEKRAPIE